MVPFYELYTTGQYYCQLGTKPLTRQEHLTHKPQWMIFREDLGKDLKIQANRMLIVIFIAFPNA